MVNRFNIYTLSLVEEKENIVEVILKNTMVRKNLNYQISSQRIKNTQILSRISKNKSTQGHINTLKKVK